MKVQNQFNPIELSHMASSLGRVTETKGTSEWLWGQLGRFENEWRSLGRVTALEVPLPKPKKKGLVPKESHLEGAFLSFIFEGGEVNHLPKRADFQVFVRGSLFGQSAMFEVEDHWRVDTHVEAEEEKCNAPSEIHPKYHFQRGGHALDSFASDESFIPGMASGISGAWRGVFQTEWPRMPALPMDPIVGIDFCIGQADGYAWRRLRNESEYFSLVENAQSRVWVPFFEELGDLDFRRVWLGELVT